MSLRARNGSVVAAWAVVLLLSMWLANQAGLQPILPEKFAGSVYLILASLPIVGGLWLAAAGFGWPLRRWFVPHVPFGPVLQAGLGMAALLLLNWLLAWAGYVGRVPGWGLVAVGVGLLGTQALLAGRRARDASAAPARVPASLILAALPLGVLLVATTLPPGTLWATEAWGYDVKSYHLQVPREWLAAGAMIPLEHNVYGYLPGLLEAGYLLVAVLHGGDVAEAAYACQLFHASFAVFAAVAVGCAVANLTCPSAGAVAGAVFLGVPWVLITGSLAYNEMAVLGFGAAAVLVLLDIRSERPLPAAAIGLLLGVATLAKPTAGPMLAAPIGLVLLTRLNHAVRWRQPPELRKAVLAAAVAAIVGVVTLTPYLARNYAWTGNPVFPFLTHVLGDAHWGVDLAARWDAAHGLAFDAEQDRGRAVTRHWLLNTGYGAVGGQPAPRESRNVAVFPREHGWPILWAAVLMAALMTVWQLRQRRAVGAMLLLIALQLAFWLAATHMQSRFLLPTVLPACVIVGLGLARVKQLTDERVRWLFPALAAALVLSLWTTGLTLFWTQTVPGRDGAGRVVALPPYLLVDALPEVRRTPLDALPPGSRVLLVADNAMLLYVDTPMIYNSAFDANPLGAIIRRVDGDAAEIEASLRGLGVTHVWVHWSELERLHATYGFDADVTEAAVRRFASRWRPVADVGAATLYALPRGG